MSRGTIIATAVALIACGVAAAAVGAWVNARSEVARLREALAEAERYADAERELTAARARMSALENELDRMQSRTASAGAAEARGTSPMGALADALGDASGPSALEVLAQLGAGAEAPGAGEGGEDRNPLAALGEMLQGEGMEQMMETSVLAQVSMMYGEFLRSDALSPEKREALRELLNAHATAQMRDGLDALTGKADWEEVQAYQQEAQAQRDAEIAALLSPTELEAWEDYQADLPRRVMSQNMDMQLSMFAPGLDADARALARDVIVEEMAIAEDQAVQEALARVAPGTTVTGVGGAQTVSQALGNARERLAGALGEEDFDELDTFMRQMEQFAQMGEEMMGAGAGMMQP